MLKPSVNNLVEKIYEATVEILVLAESEEEAKEKISDYIFVNEWYEGPSLPDWSHLNTFWWALPEQGTLKQFKENFIAKLTQEIKVFYMR